jgi:flavin reductase (DIM6/NTAB) family NADH-FMN oxidoreductase RutF
MPPKPSSKNLPRTSTVADVFGRIALHARPRSPAPALVSAGGNGARSPFDASAFRRALGRFGSGVTVIAVRAEGADYGMTASAFSSLSLSPPLVMVAVKKETRMHGHLEAAHGFTVNMLSENQEELSNRFAGGLVQNGAWTPWPKERDKFADLAFERGEVSGAALIDGSLVALDCTQHGTYDGGDHTIFVGRVEGSRLCPEGSLLRPLLYFAGAYRSLLRDPVAEAEMGLRVPDWFD